MSTGNSQRIEVADMHGLRNALCLVIALGAGICGPARAQTDIVVRNETQHELLVDATEIGGAALSPKAWKQGSRSVPPQGTAVVLSLRRKGKVNWMDPTSRFVEPGKTVLFSTAVSTSPSEDPVVLTQKLLGTGKATKMWFGAESGQVPGQWHLGNDEATHQIGWSSGTREGTVSFRAYRDKGDTHVEYTFSVSP